MWTPHVSGSRGGRTVDQVHRDPGQHRGPGPRWSTGGAPAQQRGGGDWLAGQLGKAATADGRMAAGDGGATRRRTREAAEEGKRGGGGRVHRAAAAFLGGEAVSRLRQVQREWKGGRDTARRGETGSASGEARRRREQRRRPAEGGDGGDGSGWQWQWGFGRETGKQSEGRGATWCGEVDGGGGLARRRRAAEERR